MNHEDERSKCQWAETHTLARIEVMGASGGDGDATAPLYDNTAFPLASVCACGELFNTTAGESESRAAPADDAGDDAFKCFHRQ